jgi:hypothetical protein
MKTIELFNHNNKLSNDVFIHIAAAPGTILESALPFTYLVKELKEAAGSIHDQLSGGVQTPSLEFEVEMIDFLRMPATKLSSVFTYMSHGMDRETFLKNNPNLTDVAVYIYKKK